MRAIVLLLALTTWLNAQEPSSEAILRGRKQFEQACGFCHGLDATGARGPDLIRSPLVNRDEKGELIGPVIRNGRPDKGMPPSSLTDEEIAHITAFLHAQLKTALESSQVPREYPLEKLLTGNADAGKAYFNGAGGCSTCHSPTGDLAGIARKHTPINLQARFLYPSGVRSTVAVTLPSGKQVKGELVRVDDFEVAMRDASGWYHSWPRAKVKIEVHDPLVAHRELLRKYTDADVRNVFAYLETLK